MRLELIHPMLVHFPIALLLTGVVLRFVALWSGKRPALAFLLPASWTILGLGVLAAWCAVAAGEIAEGIVRPTLENPAVLDEHSAHAYRTAIGFTIGLLLDWTKSFLGKKSWFLTTLIWIFYLFSLVNLIITGGYGASLVYEQGAAVDRRA